MLTARFLGVTGEDFAGMNPTSVGANGIPDFHLRLMGLAAVPTDVLIQSMTAGSIVGTWRLLPAGGNWLIYLALAGTQGDAWFEPYGAPESFLVTVRYPNDSTEAIAIPASPPPRTFTVTIPPRNARTVIALAIPPGATVEET